MKVYVCNVFDNGGSHEETFVYSSEKAAREFCEEYFASITGVRGWSKWDGKASFYVEDSGRVEVSEEIVDP